MMAHVFSLFYALVSHSDIELYMHLKWPYFKTEKENQDTICTVLYHGLMIQYLVIIYLVINTRLGHIEHDIKTVKEKLYY